MKYLKLFDLDADYQAFIGGGEFITPNVSYTLDTKISYFNPYVEPIDYSTQYLTFTALEDDMTVSFNKVASSGTLNYSLDEGKTWNVLESKVATPSVNAGDKIMFKGDLIPVPSYGGNGGIGIYSTTKNFDVSGNAMSLLYGDEFIGQNDLTGKNYTFYTLFSGCTKVVNAKDLILPATTLAGRCYGYMFYGCTSLTTAPKLPATTLATSCYYYMFYNCTSLTTAPELPATTLANSCYAQMFQNCTSLTSAPELPATTLTDGCYEGMFQNCTSLTSAPELPATTLANYCYHGMFQGCTSLTTAPELPAATLANSCYKDMFSGCTSLNYIKVLATNISASNCLKEWVYNVSSSGTFVKSAGANISTGVSGIPEGWTVETV